MTRRQTNPPPRQGVILLIVVILLTLFLVVGLSFVFYAESQATASRIYREASFPADVADLPAEQMLAYALSQMIFDAADDVTGVGSAARGHSLARTLYGWNYQLTNGIVDPAATNGAFAGGVWAGGGNTTPFNGVGPLRTNPAPFGLTDYEAPNYTWFRADGVLRDPERLGLRSDPTQPVTAPYAGGANVPYTYPDRTNMFLAAVKAADLSNPTQPPQVIMPSYFRPIGPFADPRTWQNLDQSNPWLNTSNPALKYMVLRPRPADMYWNGPGDPHSFPLPADAGGDVKNLPGTLGYAGGTNDSFWMDLGYPVQTTRSGRKYKPLFAITVLDMDGRVNLNVHGNVRSGPLDDLNHASHQGLGVHEINLSKVLTVPGGEWRQLLLGAGQPPNHVPGRYGPNGRPSSFLSPGLVDYPIPLIPGQRLSYLSKLDFDAVNERDTSRPKPSYPVTTRFQFPLPRGTGQFLTYPDYYKTPGYDNLTIFSVGIGELPFDEDRNWPLGWHPLLYSKLSPLPDDQPFGSDNMYHLLAGDYWQSALYSLVPNNLGGPQGSPFSLFGQNVRQLVATHTYDLDAPGAVPWVTDPSTNNRAPTNYIYDRLRLAPYPKAQQQFAFPSPTSWAGATPTGSDFKPGDGRANALSRLDLNRKLTPYFRFDGLFELGLPAAPGTLEPPLPRPFHGSFYRAQWERQQLAKDIFDRLVQATGAFPINDPSVTASLPATDPRYMALRWLAQLAVNIVDYIDDDDFITPFAWNRFAPWEIVYGTELPKLVVNEAYAEIRMDPADTNSPTVTQTGPMRQFKVNFWIELLNPQVSEGEGDPNMVTDKWHAAKRPLGDPPYSLARQSVQLKRENVINPVTGAPVTYPVYQILVTNDADQLAIDQNQPDNTLGVPDWSRTPIVLRVSKYNFASGTTADPNLDPRVVRPADGRYGKLPGDPGFESNRGFYVLGPNAPEGDVEAATSPLQPTVRLQNPNYDQSLALYAGFEGLSYPVGYSNDDSISNENVITSLVNSRHAVVLQRLACPLLPPNPPAGPSPIFPPAIDPTLPYNPYVTVDVLPHVRVNDAVRYLKSPRPGVIPPTDRSLDPTKYKPVAQRRSQGRKQPYASFFKLGTTPYEPDPAVSQVVNQTKTNAGQPMHTFFQHNDQAPPPTGPSGPTATLTVPFDWLVHLDRQLTGPMELLNVSAVRPDVLTQKFVSVVGGNLTTFAHLAPWTDPDARLFRALEYLMVGDRSIYPGTGGRRPGLININTVYSKEVLDALIDAQQSNHFTQQAVDEVWNNLLQRKQQLFSGGDPSRDRPIFPLAAPITSAGDPQLPAGVGLQDTILGGTFTPQQPTSFVPSPDPANPVNKHPYIANELLTKVSPHLTTRSNVFALFETVGFFEVMDDSTQPPKLGAEIKTSDGRIIRHRMFALIDRTNLAFDPNAFAQVGPSCLLQQSATQPVFLSTPSTVAPGATTAQLLIPRGIPTAYDGNSAVTFGQTLFADTGVNQEPVVVTATTPVVGDSTGSVVLTVSFPAGPSKGHAGGFMLCNVVPGNPGPQGAIDYNLPQYKGLIPFTYIMQ